VGEVIHAFVRNRSQGISVEGRIKKPFIKVMSWIAFKPLYKERVWGGRNLSSFLGRELPEGQVIGESWEIVDRPEAQSVVTSEKPTTIRELIANDPQGMMGPGWNAKRPFPILVKWLDCQERLSLQVHPPASIAPGLGGEPKTENWYIADAAPGSSLLVGLSAGVTRDQFEQALAETRLDSCVHRIPVKAGDSILVESGRIHAIDAGNMILEIQQNSDTTYRVYDWGRVGLDGKPREMHVEQSMKSIDFNDFEPNVLPSAPGDYVLADCREFRIRKFELTPGGAPLALSANEDPRLLHVVSGRVRDRRSGAVAVKGDNVLLPYHRGFEIEALESSLLLVTDQFTAN
jgi:mannose-6-phosphate isomerase